MQRIYFIINAINAKGDLALDQKIGFYYSQIIAVNFSFSYSNQEGTMEGQN